MIVQLVNFIEKIIYFFDTEMAGLSITVQSVWPWHIVPGPFSMVIHATCLF